jgi:hypothetical protein
MRRALDIDQQSYGPDHPNVAIRLSSLALLLQATDRLGEADPLMRRSVEIFVLFTRRTGHEHPHLRTAVGNYAGLLQAMGRSPEAGRKVGDHEHDCERTHEGDEGGACGGPDLGLGAGGDPGGERRSRQRNRLDDRDRGM